MWEYQTLKERQRADRAGHSPNLGSRVHRALCRPRRLKQLNGDPDGECIFLWIAFNPAYATEIYDDYRTSQHSLFKLFIKQYRLWLSDPLAWYGVENAKLALGYRPPKRRT